MASLQSSAALADVSLAEMPSAEPARCVMLWHWGRRGGGPLFTYELARALAQDPRIDVHLSISRDVEIADDFATLDLPTHWVDTYRGAISAVLSSVQLPVIRKQLRAYLIEHRIDTVICTMPHLWNVALVDLFQDLGIRFITTVHDAEPHPGEPVRYPRYNLRREMGYADRILTLTNYVRDTLMRKHGVAADKISVVPHGVFGEAQSIPGPRDLDRSRPLRLLFFGRILAYKGMEQLLNAYRGLREAGEAVTLTIAGSGDLSAYRGLIGDLPDITILNRWIDAHEIGGLVRAHDLVVLPYVEASQSGIVAFAYGCGLPVVATPVGGLPEQIAHLRSGIVARTADANGIQEAIAAFLRDPDLYARCSRGAVKLAANSMSWSNIAGHIADLVLGEDEADDARRDGTSG